MTAAMLILFYGLISQLAVPDYPTIAIANTYGESVDLWFRPDRTGQWETPPVELPIDSRRLIFIKYPGKHEIRLRDPKNRDSQLGKMDLEGVAARLGARPLILNAHYDKRTEKRRVTHYKEEKRTRTETITKPVWETRTKEVLVTDPFTGQQYIEIWEYKVCKNVPEERTLEYTVQVPETVEREIVVEIKSPAFMVNVDGKLVPLLEFLREYKHLHNHNYKRNANQLQAD